MASEASNIVRLQPRHNRAGNIAYTVPATVIELAEHRRLPARYEGLGRQALALDTEITTVHDFWIAVARTWENHVKSFDVSRRLHVHQHEREGTSCHTETPAQSCAVPTARKLQPDEPA
jgi:hypothetical protein